MNNQAPLVWAVARWEFNRFFKISDLVKGSLFMLAMGLIGGMVGTFLARDAFDAPDIALYESGPFTVESLASERLNVLDHRGGELDALLAQIDDGELDGILLIHSADQARLIARGERPWKWLLQERLHEVRTQFKLEELAIAPEAFEQLSAGLELNTEFRSGSTSSRADRIVAGIAIGLVLVAVFMGFAYQFSAITAEKQQRITEQVVSAISPQTWMDGKILGITGIGLIYVGYYAVLGLIGAAVMIRFGAPFAPGLALIDPWLLLTFVTLALLGILMWNAFLAAIAATIDDPNTSQKTGWVMLPLVPVGLAFFTLGNPDGGLIQFLGMFPLTSYAVLPARMVLTSVAWWEVAVALLALIATVWLFRRIAGKIFAAGMMMYGKEPNLKEMWGWFRQS
jgi:ABC-2 type transport system permease protein